MFKSVTSFGDDSRTGQHWSKTVFPCGCMNHATWFFDARAQQEHGNEETFHPCETHAWLTSDIPPMVVRSIKRAMCEAGLIPGLESDWEVLIKCMQSPHFPVLVNQFKPVRGAAPTISMPPPKAKLPKAGPTTR